MYFCFSIYLVITTDFIRLLFEKHNKIPSYPSTSSVSGFVIKLFLLLFPEQTNNQFDSQKKLVDAFVQLQVELEGILRIMQVHLPQNAAYIAKYFFEVIPEIYRVLNTDAEAIYSGDPAAKSEYEVIRAYPGFYAIAFYRFAHILHNLEVPLIPRLITEYAHSKTGIDIHPAAIIDEYFYIDHGTGTVIGETCHIGKNVKLYQAITLGALSVSKNMVSLKRHPTIEDDVVIYSGATILGGETIIGKGSIVGGNVWLTRSIAPGTKIYHQEQVKIS